MLNSYPPADALQLGWPKVVGREEVSGPMWQYELASVPFRNLSRPALGLVCLFLVAMTAAPAGLRAQQQPIRIENTSSYLLQYAVFVGSSRSPAVQKRLGPMSIVNIPADYGCYWIDIWPLFPEGIDGYAERLPRQICENSVRLIVVRDEDFGRTTKISCGDIVGEWRDSRGVTVVGPHGELWYYVDRRMVNSGNWVCHPALNVIHFLWDSSANDWNNLTLVSRDFMRDRNSGTQLTRAAAVANPPQPVVASLAGAWFCPGLWEININASGNGTIDGWSKGQGTISSHQPSASGGLIKVMDRGIPAWYWETVNPANNSRMNGKATLWMDEGSLMVTIHGDVTRDDRTTGCRVNRG